MIHIVMYSLFRIAFPHTVHETKLFIFSNLLNMSFIENSIVLDSNNFAKCAATTH